eukprot:5868688-Pleurochrysis_carterae.AAC.3
MSTRWRDARRVSEVRRGDLLRRDGRELRLRSAGGAFEGHPIFWAERRMGLRGSTRPGADWMCLLVHRVLFGAVALSSAHTCTAAPQPPTPFLHLPRPITPSRAVHALWYRVSHHMDILRRGTREQQSRLCGFWQKFRARLSSTLGIEIASVRV